jgi:DNA repair exonuclease SbcCD ATPase subunit
MPVANYRITELSVEGFRGFTTWQSLSFEGRNVFVFGQNGHGKSSIIEAIQWCLFGGSDIEVRNSVYEKQECRVSLRLAGAKGSLTIERELRPGRNQSDRRIKDGGGNEVPLRDVFPQLAKLRSQHESTQVIFAAQQAVSRRVTADITEFGRVLCFYLKLEDVPDLVKQMADLIQVRRSEAEAFAKRIEDIAHRYRQKLMTLQTQIETLLANPPWGDGPSPTATETGQRITDFVREISKLLNQTFPVDLSPADLLQKADEWINLLTQRDLAAFQNELARLSQRIQQLETLIAQVRDASSLVLEAKKRHRERQQRVKDILAGHTRDAILGEMHRREAAQTKRAAALAIAERVAKLCEEHVLEACPACGSNFDHGGLVERVKAQLGVRSKLDSDSAQLEELRARLRELDEAVAAQANSKNEVSVAREQHNSVLQELASLVGQDKAKIELTDVETRLAQLKSDLATLRRNQNDQRDEKQKLQSRIKVYRQELTYQSYRDQIKKLERQLGAGMEEARQRLRDSQNFLYQVDELKRLVEAAFKNALDRAIPPLNELLTAVYQRLTQQRSFELVRVYHDPAKIGNLELRVASKRRPDTDHPVNVLNGQASKALHLVPYFVFSRFQPELLELDLLLIDDPSESFDTSHVALLVEELRIAAEHAQLIVASHEQEKFSPHVSEHFGENDFVTMTVSDFDPDLGPHIERQ